MADILISIQGDSSSLTTAVSSATSSLGQLEAAGTKTGGVLGSVMSSIGSGLGLAAGMAVMQGLAGAMGAVGDAAIGLNSRLEQARIGFTTMLGSAQQADVFLRDLQAFANKTPFTFPELVTASQRMLAFGFSASQVKPLLTAVGDAVSAVGGGAEAINGVTLALGQMQAKGKVSAQEMNQLAERGIPAWDMLSQATGKTTAELMKMAEKGLIPAQVMIDAFVSGSASRFGGMMAEQAKTFQGALSTISDVVSMTTANAFKPLFQVIADGALILADFLQGDEFQTWAAALAVGFQAAVDWVGSFMSALAPLGAAISTAFSQFTSGDFAAGFATLGTAISTIFTDALAKVQAFATGMFGAGVSLVTELASGIIEAGSSLLTNAVNTIAEIIASFLIGNSPPAAGPLAQIGQGGANVITAWGDGALGAVSSAVSPVVAAVADNLNGLKEVGRGAEMAIHDIGRAISEIDIASRDLKNSAEDVKRSYDDQTKALDVQIASLDKVASATREREKMEMSLEEHILKQAEVQAMGDPVLRTQLQTRLATLKAQQEQRKNTEAIADAEIAASGTRKEQLQHEADSVKFTQQRADLEKRLHDAKTPAEKASAEAALKELNIRQQIGEEDDKQKQVAAERRIADAKARKEQLDVQAQIDGLVDQNALARVKEQEATLRARQQELDLTDRRAKIEAALAAGPLKEERERLIAERDATLKPMEAQLEMMSRQKEALQAQKAVYADIKQQVADQTAAIKEQAKATTEAVAAQKKSVEAFTPDAVVEASVKKAKEAGAKLAASIGEGFSTWISANFVGIAAGAIGSVLGGMAFGPVGAVAGALLATSIVTGVQKKLSEQGLDLSMLTTKVSDEIGKLVGLLTPTFQRLTEVVRTALGGDLQGAFDKFLISMQLTSAELGPTITSWGDAFKGLGEKIGAWIKAEVDLIPWATIWSGVKFTAKMIADSVIAAGIGLDNMLTKWMNDQIIAIKWAELGTAFGKSLVGSAQTGFDESGPSIAKLDTAGLKTGLTTFFTAALRGGWAQALANWRAENPGSSYGKVFVDGLDASGIGGAVKVVFAKMLADYLDFQGRWNAEIMRGLGLVLGVFVKWGTDLGATLVKAQEGIWQAWSDGWTTASTIVTTWTGKILTDVGTWLQSISDSFTTWVTDQVASWELWWSTQWDSFTTWKDKLFADFGIWLQSISDSFTTWVAEQVAAWDLWWSTQWTSLTTWVAKILADFTIWLAAVGTAFTTWVAEQLAAWDLWWQTQWDAFIVWKDKLLADFGTWLTDTAQVISDGWDAIWARVGEAWDAIWSLIGEKLDAIKGYFTTAVTEWTTFGTDMATGLIGAVKTGLDKLVETVVTPIKGAIDTVRGMLSSLGSGPSGAVPTGSAQGGNYDAAAIAAARRAGIPDPERFAAQMRQESGDYAPDVVSGRRKSSSGAEGLAQFTPGTRAQYPHDPTDPIASLDAAARYLADLIKLHGSQREAEAHYYGAPSADSSDGRVYSNAIDTKRKNVVIPGPGQMGDVSAQLKVDQTVWASGMAGAADICGPYAAAIFADYVGRPPTPQEAAQLATKYGWTPGQGMTQSDQVDDLANAFIQQNNPGSAMRVSETRTSNPAQAGQLGQAGLATGAPVGFNTSRHYFVADDFNAATGAFHVGSTGTTMGRSGGQEWMTIDQIAAVGQGLLGVLTISGQLGAGITDLGTTASAGLGVVAQAGAGAATTVMGSFDLMRTGSLQSVTDLGTGVLTTMQDMNGNTVATVTDMAGNVTSQSATLANGVSMNMGAMGVSSIAATDLMAGTITTTMTDAAGNMVVTTTNMSGQVVGQYTAMQVLAGASVATMATDVTTQSSDLGSKLTSDVTNLAGVTVERWTDMSGKVVTIVTDSNGNVVADFTQTSADIGTVTDELHTKLISTTTDSLGNVTQIYQESTGEIVTIVTDASGQVIAQYTDTQERSTEAVQKLADDTQSAADDIVSGLDTITPATQDVTNALKSMKAPDPKPFVDSFRKIGEAAKKAADAISEVNKEHSGKRASDGGTDKAASHAGGGWAMGLSLVGEQGPELVSFSKPRFISTAAQTRSLLGGAGPQALGGGSSPLERHVIEFRIGGAIAESIYLEGRGIAIKRGVITP